MPFICCTKSQHSGKTEQAEFVIIQICKGREVDGKSTTTCQEATVWSINIDRLRVHVEQQDHGNTQIEAQNNQP